MPGELKPSARCPHCGDNLIGIVDTTSGSLGTVVREYFHAKPSAKVRRKRRCKVTFHDFEKAQRERKGLEVSIIHRLHSRKS